MDACCVCICSIEEDIDVVYACFDKTDFANKESCAASRQIYENPCHQYFTVIAHFDNVNVVIVVAIVIVVFVVTVIIAIIKEVVIALAS
jgi:hypothetical protein